MSKAIITIQDYSCVGRCSLTVALPIISACGIECVGVPTALLSNHTAYPSYTFLDLTSEMQKIIKQFSLLEKKAEIIYTGYLAKGQSKAILELQKNLGDIPLFVDPAFADNGRFYKGLDESIVSQSKELISHADIIKPNLSEAMFLLGMNFDVSRPHNADFYIDIVEKLSKLGPKKIVLTGASTKENEIGMLIYENGQAQFINDEKLPGKYHGTGDCFASALIGSYIKGKSLYESTMIAHEFVKAAIKETIRLNKNGLKCGPEFESALPLLFK